MAGRKAPTSEEWFSNCGGWRPRHDLDELRRGIAAGRTNEQDRYGMTGLGCAVGSKWTEGVDELLRAGADTELRYFRTGETALYMAVLDRNEAMARALIGGGADPDAGNHWGLTPRRWLSRTSFPDLFDGIPAGEVRLPPPRIQNAEHLAEHHYPRFKIPDRQERESMKVGQAVDLYVYGPKAETKQDTVKVRITARAGRRPRVRYTATIETPIERTHLAEGTTVVEFAPENIASVYVPGPARKRK